MCQFHKINQARKRAIKNTFQRSCHFVAIFPKLVFLLEMDKRHTRQKPGVTACEVLVAPNQRRHDRQKVIWREGKSHVQQHYIPLIHMEGFI